MNPVFLFEGRVDVNVIFLYMIKKNSNKNVLSLASLSVNHWHYTILMIASSMESKNLINLSGSCNNMLWAFHSCQHLLP